MNCVRLPVYMLLAAGLSFSAGLRPVEMGRDQREEIRERLLCYYDFDGQIVPTYPSYLPLYFKDVVKADCSGCVPEKEGGDVPPPEQWKEAEPAFSEGRFGKALQVRPYQYLHYPNSTAEVCLWDHRRGTIMLWIKPTRDIRLEKQSRHYYGIPSENFRLFSTGPAFTFSYGKGKVVAACRWPKDTWHFVAGTWKEDGELLLYVDGRFFEQLPEEPRGKHTRYVIPGFCIGSDLGYRKRTGSGSNATVDELAIFNRALTREEIGVLHKQTEPLQSFLHLQEVEY